VFLVRSVYFNLRNILPKSGTFLPGHPVYTDAVGLTITVELFNDGYAMTLPWSL